MEVFSIINPSTNIISLLTYDGTHCCVWYIEVSGFCCYLTGRHWTPPCHTPSWRHEAGPHTSCSCSAPTRTGPRPRSSISRVGGWATGGHAHSGHHGCGMEAGEHEGVRLHQGQVSLISCPQLGGHLSLCLGDVGDGALDGDNTLRVETVNISDRTDSDPSVCVLQIE